MQEGKSQQEIRAYIDAEYSKYGPPTDTGPVQEGSAGSCTTETASTCGETASGPSDLPAVAGPNPTDN